jgi:hypothetical protein
MSEHTMHHHGEPSTRGLHGMLLVGEDPMYASHLPMFMAPHNYQAILRITLPDDVRRRLGDVRADFGKDLLVTLRPEVFAITDLVAPEAPLRAFRADVVKGHFEHGGDPVGDAVTVTVEDVVVFQELDLAASLGGDLSYLLFGDADRDLFLAHRIGHRPGFDQVLRVGIEGEHFTQAEIDRQGRPTVTVPGRPDSPSDRLAPDEVVAAHSSAGLHFERDLQVTVLSEIYMNSDELQ